MNDTMMFGVVGIGFVLWVFTYVVEHAWKVLKRRKLDKQVVEGVVPRDYSRKLKVLQQELNQGNLLTDEQNATWDRLQSLRERVGLIRLAGYDAGDVARVERVEFALGIGKNPYPRGTGEAQQWARGFCQATGQPPKHWMARA